MGSIQKAKIANDIADLMNNLAPYEREKFANDLQKLNVNHLRWIKEELEEKMEVNN